MLGPLRRLRQQAEVEAARVQAEIEVMTVEEFDTIANRIAACIYGLAIFTYIALICGLLIYALFLI
jgi:hypothetical protein